MESEPVVTGVDHAVAKGRGVAPATGLDLRQNFELLATAFGVGAILLPLGGLLVRDVAFASANVDDYRELILGDSLPSLALTGFVAILSSLGFLIAVLAAYLSAPWLHRYRSTMPMARRITRDGEALDADAQRMLSDLEATRALGTAGEMTAAMEELERRGDELARRSHEFRAALNALQTSEDWRRLNETTARWEIRLAAAGPVARAVAQVLGAIGRLGWVGFAISALVAASFILFLVSWPASLVLLMAWVLVAFVVPWLGERGHLLRFAVVFLVTAAVVGLSAIGDGLNGATGSEYLAVYDFKPEANMTSGQYVHVAEANGTLLLQDCESRNFVAVDASSVAHVTEVSYRTLADRPALWDVLVKHKQPVVGYQTECPA